MQTIARANRVAEGKSNGLIIDYIGIVKALRKALADYTANVGCIDGTDPTVDKVKLIERILDTLEKAKLFLAERGFVLQDLICSYDFPKMYYLQKRCKYCLRNCGGEKNIFGICFGTKPPYEVY